MRDGRTRTEFAARAGAPTGVSFHHFADLDREQAEETLGRFFTPVRVSVPDNRPFRMTSSVLCLGPLTVGDLTFGPATTIDAESVGGYHVSIPLAGEMRSRHSDA